MTKLLSIGVDVGSCNGAIAVVDTSLNIKYLAKAPYYTVPVKSKKLKDKLNRETGLFESSFKQRKWTSFQPLMEIYKPYLKYNKIYTIEKVFVRPKEGEVNSFIFGNSLGVHEGMYAYLNPIDFYEPTPNTWKKEMGVTSNKSTSISLAEDIYDVKLTDYLINDKLDDIAEALLLAFYGLKKHAEKNG